jgi:hypothetical protein
MRPKFQKQSALKLAGRIIPQSGGNNNQERAFGYYSCDDKNSFAICTSVTLPI